METLGSGLKPVHTKPVSGKPRLTPSRGLKKAAAGPRSPVGPKRHRPSSDVRLVRLPLENVHLGCDDVKRGRAIYSMKAEYEVRCLQRGPRGRCSRWRATASNGFLGSTIPRAHTGQAGSHPGQGQAAPARTCRASPTLTILREGWEGVSQVSAAFRQSRPNDT